MKPAAVFLLFTSLASGAIVRKPAVNHQPGTHWLSQRDVSPPRVSPDKQVPQGPPDETKVANVKKPKFFWKVPARYTVGWPGSLYLDALYKKWIGLLVRSRIREFNPFKDVSPDSTLKHRINNRGFCSTLRGLGWIASGLTRHATSLQHSKMPAAADNKTRPTVLSSRMITRWSGHLKTLQTRLSRTESFSNQMLSASCYVDYVEKVSAWLVALRKLADKFDKMDPTRQDVSTSLKKLAMAHLGVARLVHDTDKPLINEIIPDKDTTGSAETLKSEYKMKAGQPLQTWVKDSDPICPLPKGGLFQETIMAWRYELKNETEEDKEKAYKASWIMEPKPEHEGDDDDDDDDEKNKNAWMLKIKRQSADLDNHDSSSIEVTQPVQKKEEGKNVPNEEEAGSVKANTEDCGEDVPSNSTESKPSGSAVNMKIIKGIYKVLVPGFQFWNV
ncbi:uncharacterized protein HRG_06285 [Hirsutella rhossiliensis]|uniref:Uncharacterized protein n=1 Tax=Hirsutella rhossiliensis TaxID=111463 RepID=A0A9P8MU65_9HYPO|nr:uncharacterized protein HRG_06285 [Hirsutella rhossiliensis]KAH0962183.1 hypothetical protein HRG_06285 [Hirsutella rhossiliensis]